MIELEFKKKVKKYSDLSKKVKKLKKIKDKLNLEIKEEIITRINRKIESGEKVRVKIRGYCAVLKKRERVNAKKGKINKFLSKHKEKISDYYSKTEYFTLYVMRNKREIREDKLK